jgi:hypothetical protein
MFFPKNILVVFGLLVAFSTFISAAPAPVGNDDLELLPRGPGGRAIGNVIKNLNLRLSPPRNGAVFWSGRHPNGGSTMHAAADFAKKTGRQTLEMGLAKAKINMPAYSASTKPVWDHASKLWAERAKGKTSAVLGQVRDSSIYKTIEKPALNKNKKVTGHTEHILKPKQFPVGKSKSGPSRAAKSAKAAVQKAKASRPPRAPKGKVGGKRK